MTAPDTATDTVFSVLWVISAYHKVLNATHIELQYTKLLVH